MINSVHFILICEGSSDENIIPHLRDLIVTCGIDQVSGTALDYALLPNRVSRDIQSKIKVALLLEKNADLIFIHRDADSRNPEPRYQEISNGVIASNYHGKWIALVPVQKIEAWLLLDETAIRRAAGRPNGNIRLDLPRPEHIENIASPKEMLKDIILSASEASGYRLKKIRKKFPAIRARLLNELRDMNTLERVPAWARLKHDIQIFVDFLKDLDR